MTPDALSTLATRAGELMKADDRIAALALIAGRDPAARAPALLEAIADRERIAATVLEAIAREDRAYQSLMADVPDGVAPGLTAKLIRRDRRIEALVEMVATRSREYGRIARQLEAASDRWRERRPRRQL